MIPREVVERARLGASSDLERFAELMWPDAYKLAYAVLGQRPAAEDAAQEACMAACLNVGSLRSADAFRVWFARIVVREASAVRKRAARAVPARDELPVEAHDAAATIDVSTALGMLPTPLRTVVVLRYFEDLTSRDIGAVLGIPAPTVRFRLMVALRRLRPLLDLSEHRASAPEVPSRAC